MPRYYEYKNERTGEQASAALIVKGSRYPRHMRFSTSFSDGFAHLATLDLTKTQWRILMLLLASMGYKNTVTLTQKAIAETLGLPRPNVSTAIKALINQKLLARTFHPEDPGLGEVLQVSVNHVWRGRARDWNDAIMRGGALRFADVPRRTPAPRKRQVSLDGDDAGVDID
jgi:phage replication O-like protein O